MATVAEQMVVARVFPADGAWAPVTDLVGDDDPADVTIAGLWRSRAVAAARMDVRPAAALSPLPPPLAQKARRIERVAVTREVHVEAATQADIESVLVRLLSEACWHAAQQGAGLLLATNLHPDVDLGSDDDPAAPFCDGHLWAPDRPGPARMTLALRTQHRQ